MGFEIVANLHDVSELRRVLAILRASQSSVLPVFEQLAGAIERCARRRVNRIRVSIYEEWTEDEHADSPFRERQIFD